MAALRPAFATLLIVGLALAAPARAQETARDASPEVRQAARLERLRGEFANQLQLRAYDLVDELIFGWTEAPPFQSATPVVLADVVAPVGMGSGIEGLVENHLAQVLLRNPRSNVQLAHCPACNSFVVHSDATGTVLGRGVDNPKALEKLRGGAGAQYALFLDFEVEGRALVLRARMTKLEPALPIVFARTLTTTTSTAALLRSPDRLLSAEDARAEYLAVLERRGPLTIPVRLQLVAFAASSNAAIAAPTPIPWLQSGVELAITSSRAWTGSIVVGGVVVPTVVTGAMVQGRVARLLSGSSYSLTWPNLYGFFHVSMAAVQGPTATILAATDNPPGILDVLGPLTAYPALGVGLELRISDRIGASIFAENVPTLVNADNVGNWLDSLPFGFNWGVFKVQSLGGEATFAF